MNFYVVFEKHFPLLHFVSDLLIFSLKWLTKSCHSVCVMENCSTVASDEVQLPDWPKEPRAVTKTKTK